MFNKREKIITRIKLICQILLAISAFIVSCLLYSPATIKDILEKDYIFQITLIVFIWFILIRNSGLCLILKEQSSSRISIKYLKTILWATILFYSISGLIGIGERNFLFWGLFYIVNCLFLYTFMSLFYMLMSFVRRKGYNKRQVLIIADKMSFDFIERIGITKDWGYRIWGIQTDSREIQNAYGDKYTLLPGDQDLVTILDNYTIDEVFYCKETVNYNEVTHLIALCAETGIIFNIKPAFNYCQSIRPEFNVLNDSPIFTYQNTPDDYLSLKIKRCFDIFFSLAVLSLGAPFFFIIALIIKLNDGGPVFFMQERVGLNGRSFSCFKFRTMVVNAEALQPQLKEKNEQTGPVFKIRMDPRVTRVGRFLRKTSLDELPQFLNVLHGDMSIVGPRPPIPTEVKEYKRQYHRRLSMKPGITCIWQVSGRNNISFDEWMQLDLKYIDNWSLLLDLRIILKTIMVMLKGDGQ